MSTSFVHTLSFPERLWIEFWREFFSQKALIVDENGVDITNRFRFEEAKDPANREFDILLEYDLDKGNPNILPALVLEDMGLARLNIGLNDLHTWGVSPKTFKERSDLIRSTYVFHCCSRNRGESRLLASIVSNAITVFYDELKRCGFHKIEPWSIGKTIPLKLDSDEVYVNTPVNVTFEFQQTWKTVESGNGFFERYCFVVKGDELLRYVHSSVDITDPVTSSYVNSKLEIVDENLVTFILSSTDFEDPVSDSQYMLASMDAEDPDFSELFVRTSMRIA